MDPITSSLIAGALIKGAEASYSRMKSYLSDPDSEKDLSRLETAFLSSFQEHLYDEFESSQDSEILEFSKWWRNNSSDLQEFENIRQVDDVIDELLTQAYSHPEFTVNEDSRQKLRLVIGRAYQNALSDFYEYIGDNPNLAARLNRELGIEALDRVENAIERIDRLIEHSTPIERFELFDSNEIEAAVDELLWWEDNPPNLVNRWSDDDYPKQDWLLIVAPTGSGKSRVVEELLRKRAHEVDQIMIVKEGMKSQDVWAFERMKFDGDVLLVWDEIGKRGVLEDFRNVLQSLFDHLDDQGYNLKILAATRSSRVSGIPERTINKPQDIDRSSVPIWRRFSPIQLERLDENRLTKLVERISSARNVELDPGVRDALVRKVKHISAPAYINALAQTADSLSIDDIDELPGSASDVWREAFSKLDEREMKVLRSCKLLDDTGYPLQSEVVLGVYRHVLNGGGKDSFQSDINSLVNYGWLNKNVDRPFGPGVVYRLHDTQLEAVDRDLVDYAPEFSEYLLNFVGSSTNLGERELVNLHNQFGDYLYDQGELSVARDHLQFSLRLSSPSENILKSDDLEGHQKYSKILLDLKEIPEARDHCERTLELSSPTGEIIDSELTEAHYDYAKILLIEGQPEQASNHMVKSAEISAEYYEELDMDLRGLEDTLAGISDFSEDLPPNLSSLGIRKNVWKAISKAIQKRVVGAGVFAACIRSINDPLNLSQTADFLLNIEKIHTAFIFGFYEGTVYASARTVNADIHMAEALRQAFGQVGRAGTHVELLDDLDVDIDGFEDELGHSAIGGAQLPMGILGEVEANEAVKSAEAALEETLIDRFFEVLGIVPESHTEESSHYR